MSLNVLGATLELDEFVEDQRCPAANGKLVTFGVLSGASRLSRITTPWGCQSE